MIGASSRVRRQWTTESCLHQTPEGVRVSSCAIGHRLASPLDQSDAAKRIRFPREALYNCVLRKQDVNTRALYVSLRVFLPVPLYASPSVYPFPSCAFHPQQCLLSSDSNYNRVHQTKYNGLESLTIDSLDKNFCPYTPPNEPDISSSFCRPENALHRYTNT